MFIPKNLKIRDLIPGSLLVRNVIFDEKTTRDGKYASSVAEVLFMTNFRCDTIKFEIPYGSVYVILECAV